MTRLINADDIPYAVNIDHPSGEYDYAYRCEIDAMPTVDAVAVVHAQWIIEEDPVFADKYYCSNCGEQANVDLYGEWILSKHCPNCGARMDAEREE